MKAITNIIEKEGGIFTKSPPKEKNSAKKGSETQGKTLRSSRPSGRRPSTTQKKKGGSIHQEEHQGRGTTPMEVEEHEEEH
jgi:hypothetical protein